jgi:hypothetical protein
VSRTFPEPLKRCPAGSKVCYRSPAAARKMIRKQRNYNGAVLRVYRCRACGDWHLTKQPVR